MRNNRRQSRQDDPVEPESEAGGRAMLHMTADLIPAFSGRDKTYEVTRWIEDVEDHAEIFGWTPLQQLLVARRALTGTAALWLRAERPHKSWLELKAALIKEFTDSMDTKTIHEMMSARKKHRDESCSDYMLVMKELGRRGKMADYVAIKYIVDGIVDREQNKIMLYGVTSYNDLKEKLKIYETFKEKTRYESEGQRQRNTANSNMQARGQVEARKCYNCGENKHISAECPHRNKGAKCFSCNTFGHLASQCGVRQGGSSGSGDRSDVATSNQRRPNFRRMQDGNRARSNSASARIPTKQTSATFCCDCETERSRLNDADGSTSGHEQDGGARDAYDTDPADVLNVNIGGKIHTKPLKSLEICGKTINALVDSGSDVNLMSVECYRSLGSPKSLKSDVVLTGLGAQKVRALGLCITTVRVDGQTFKDTSFHIVPKDVMPYSIIIGQNFLQHTVMVMDNNRVFLLPANEEWFRNVMCFVSDLDIIGGEISPATQQQVRRLMTSYVPAKTKEAPIMLQIHLKDDVPVAQRPRRLALKEQQEVDSQIQQWLDEGIIRVSTSEYSSPIVLVRKKDGTLRVCVDYRKLNQKMVKDQYPLPLIDSHIDRCQNAKIFSALDLKNGYFHLRVHEDSIQYTSFVTMTGQYEFLRAPFGIAICPKVFTRFISIIFRDLIAKGSVIIFIDDLLIPAETEQEALERLNEVLQTASDYGLNINWKKSQLMVRRVEYLGHLIENGEIRPSTGKTEAVARYPEPKDVKQLHSFIGLCSYFRKFIQNFAFIAKPLTDLLRKDELFMFTDVHKKSFNTLKEKLTSGPVLTIFNPRRKTELHTDASGVAYSAILLQQCSEDGELHPVHYFSRKTSETQSKYTSYELEALAIVEGVKKFRHYLFGLHFKIVTDCKAFEMTLKKKDLAMSTRVARWILLLQDYDFEVEHREGSRMRHVDALSRHPYVGAIFADLHDGIRYSQDCEDGMKAIKEILKENSFEDYVLDNGLLYKGLEKRLVIPKTLETEIIKRAHDNGHFSKKKMMQIISKDFYIPNLEKKVGNFILTCIPCLLATRKEGKQEGYLNPIDKQDVPLHTVHIDHVGPMTETKKQYNYIFTVVDAFTKFTWIFPTKSTTAKEALDKLKVHQQHFGNPARIISDRGAAFTSQEFEDYCQQEGILHIKITTGIPRGNGQVERIQKNIVSILTKMCIENPALWYRHVSRVQRALNSTFHRSIKMSPFELLTGTKMKCREDIEIYNLLEQEMVETYMTDREELRMKAKQEILKIQDENTKTYNRKRKPSQTYAVGDVVAIRKTQYGVCTKIKPKYLGPYKVVAAKGCDRYEVEKLDSLQEGPRRTSSAADSMKPWPMNDDSGSE